MILMQFDLPTERAYQPEDRYPFALRILRGASDDAVGRLHGFMVGDLQDVPFGGQPWAPDQLKLFVSHLAAHRQFIGQVRQTLLKDHVDAFVAHTTIEPSKEWEDVLEAALLTCDAMVVFLHRGFHVSNWCDQEVGFGLARRVPTLVIAIDEMPYGFMSKFQALSETGTDAEQLGRKISNWLVKVPTLQPIMAECIVTALEDSRSYERTRWLVMLLQGLPQLTPQQLQRLFSTAKTNDQVRDARLGRIPAPVWIEGLTLKPQLQRD